MTRFSVVCVFLPFGYPHFGPHKTLILLLLHTKLKIFSIFGILGKSAMVLVTIPTSFG